MRGQVKLPLTPAYGFGFERRSLALALRLLDERPQLFTSAFREQARTLLGIGAVKVEALGRWAVCSGLMTPAGQGHQLSSLGHVVASFDPSLEEIGTWWLIHESLTRRHEPWGWYTCEFLRTSFSMAELDEGIKASFEIKSDRAVQNARRALVAAMTRTPLGPELGLMVESSQGLFERRPTDPATVNPALVGYAVMSWARTGRRLTANTEELLVDRGPGVVLGLTRSSLDVLLEQAEDRYREEVLWASHTAGLNSVAFSEETQPLHLVDAYYLERLEGREPYAALQYARTEGLSARLLATANSGASANG